MNYSDRFHQLQLQIWDVTWTRYITEELFSAQWWGLVVLLAALYALWLKLLDKPRTFEIMLFGSFVAVQAVMVDIAGYSIGLWQHNIRLFPIVPGVFPLDFTVVPILLMFAHQYGDTWSRYLTWSVVASVIFSFGVSPVFQYFGIKAYYNWNFGYFFLLMMAVAVISRLVIQLVTATVEESTKGLAPSRRFFYVPNPAAKPMPQPEEEKNNTDKN